MGEKISGREFAESSNDYEKLLEKWFPEKPVEYTDDPIRSKKIKNALIGMAEIATEELPNILKVDEKLDFSLESLEKLDSHLSEELVNNLIKSSDPKDDNSDFKTFVKEVSCYFYETIRRELENKGLNYKERLFWPYQMSELAKIKESQEVTISPFHFIAKKIGMGKEEDISFKTKYFLNY